MPRRSSGGLGRSSSRPTSSSSRSASPAMAAPARAAPAPAQPVSSGGIGSGILGGIMQGMTFGAGSEIGHQAVRGMFGSGHSEPVIIQQSAAPAQQSSQNQKACTSENDLFINCLKSNGNSISFCQSYFDMLKECESKN